MPSRRRLLYAALATALALAGGEALARVGYPVIRTATLPPDMVASHVTAAGFRYDPDLLWYWEKTGIYDVNEQGFRRAAPVSPAPAPGVVRAFAFGDSQTLGAGLSLRESWPGVADAQLGPTWELINAAVPGYRSLNVYRLLQLKIAALAPDVLVVDNFPADSPRDDGPLAGKPVGGSLGDEVRALLWKSRLYYALRLVVDRLRPDQARWLSQAGTDLRSGKDLGNHDLIVAWARARDVHVMFLQYPVMTEDGRLDCMTGDGELPDGAAVSRACDALADLGVPATDLFMDRNHLTVRGAAVVGERVAEDLRRWRAGEPPLPATQTWRPPPPPKGPVLNGELPPPPPPKDPPPPPQGPPLNADGPPVIGPPRAVTP